ncbi:MAG: FtsW/RodA/SpoVE family cell cycle protein [Paraclostridium sp.]
MKKHTLKLLKELDFKLILTIVLIFTFGIVILSSATHVNKTGNYKHIIKQLLAFSIGILLVLIIISIDYDKLGTNYKYFYMSSIFLLLILWVPGLGKVQEGARRWIKLGPLYLQTSELVKLTFIISYAKIVEKSNNKLNSIKEILPVLFKAIPILILMLIQPDLGGTIVFGCIMLGMLFTAGLNLKIIRNTIAIIIIALPIIYIFLAPHQKVRIEAFLHPDDLSYPGNYQVVESMIAIGSGGSSLLSSLASLGLVLNVGMRKRKINF